MSRSAHVNPSFPTEPAGVGDDPLPADGVATPMTAAPPRIVKVGLGAGVRTAHAVLTGLQTVHRAVDGGVAVVSAVLFPLSLPLHLCRSGLRSRVKDPAVTSHG